MNLDPSVRAPSQMAGMRMQRWLASNLQEQDLDQIRPTRFRDRGISDGCLTDDTPTNCNCEGSVGTRTQATEL